MTFEDAWTMPKQLRKYLISKELEIVEKEQLEEAQNRNTWQ
jgi:hypothetical protein